MASSFFDVVDSIVKKLLRQEDPKVILQWWREKFAIPAGLFVNGDYFEMVVLFIFYLVLRWFPRVRGTAVIVLASVCISITNLILSKLSTFVSRYCIFLNLTSKSFYLKRTKLHINFSNVVSGPLALLWTLLLFPVVPFWVVYALIRPCTYDDRSLSLFWRKLGGQAYKIWKILYKYFVQGTSEPLSSVEDASSNHSADQIQESTCHSWMYANVGKILFLVFLWFVASYWHVFLVISTAYALGISKHVPAIFIIAMEVFATWTETDLGLLRYEIAAWICFTIPIIVLVTYVFCTCLLDALHSVLRHDLGSHHRLSKLTLIFHSIPVSESEMAVKVWDTGTGNHSLKAARLPKFFAVFVRGGEQNELRSEFYEDGEEEDIASKLEHELSGDLHGETWRDP